MTNKETKANQEASQPDAYPDIREKTFSTKLRLAESIYQLEKEKAEKRQQDPLESVGHGSVRDIVGNHLGWSGEKYRQARKVWQASEDSSWAERLVNDIEADKLSISRAYELWTNPWLDVVFDDALEALPSVQDGAVDLILADPPFNVDFNYKECEDNRSTAEYTAWVETWLRECYRVLEDGGYAVVFLGHKSLPAISQAIEKTQFQYQHLINWIKPQGQGGLPGTNLFNRTEYAIILSKGDYDHQGNNNSKETLYEDKITVKRKRPDEPPQLDHNCPRPIELYERIITFFSDEGDVVLDPFLGSGTTAVAGLKTGRNVMGIEISDEYRSDIEKRLQHSIDEIDDYQASFSDIFISHTRGDLA